jgi:hypothetical protein
MLSSVAVPELLLFYNFYFLIFFLCWRLWLSMSASIKIYCAGQLPRVFRSVKLTDVEKEKH